MGCDRTTVGRNRASAPAGQSVQIIEDIAKRMPVLMKALFLCVGLDDLSPREHASAKVWLLRSLHHPDSDSGGLADRTQRRYRNRGLSSVAASVVGAVSNT